jgi:S-(hydroxymethyl)glutathione dehydrogenase/alcohol dehydrogenase
MLRASRSCHCYVSPAAYASSGTAFGGFKSRTDVPKLVQKCIDGKLPVDHFITHTFDGVGCTNDAIDALHGGKCLRAVVRY